MKRLKIYPFFGGIIEFGWADGWIRTIRTHIDGLCSCL